MSDAHDGLIARLEETLTCQRYSRVVVHNYCRNARDFLSYLSERSIALEAVTPTQVSQPGFPGWRSLALTISAALINVRPLLSRACLRTILWDLMPRWLSSDEGVHRVRSA
jgi:hypothetical protein